MFNKSCQNNVEAILNVSDKLDKIITVETQRIAIEKNNSEKIDLILELIGKIRNEDIDTIYESICDADSALNRRIKDIDTMCFAIGQKLGISGFFPIDEKIEEPEPVVEQPKKRNVRPLTGSGAADMANKKLGYGFYMQVANTLTKDRFSPWSVFQKEGLVARVNNSYVLTPLGNSKKYKKLFILGAHNSIKINPRSGVSYLVEWAKNHQSSNCGVKA